MTDGAWISVLGSAVTALAALGGVLVAQRASRDREHEGRLWEKRSAVYEELLGWALDVSHAASLTSPDEIADAEDETLSSADVEKLVPSGNLESRVATYASDGILREFYGCLRGLRRVSIRGEIAVENLV